MLRHDHHDHQHHEPIEQRHNHSDPPWHAPGPGHGFNLHSHGHGHAHAHAHTHAHALGHGHAHAHFHEPLEHPGTFSERERSVSRDYSRRAFTVGVGGPVGSGKTALMLALCLHLRDRIGVAAVTNDIFTREDGEFLVRHRALPSERIRAVETGGCPHAAIRDDITANLLALEDLHRAFQPDLLLVESGGDNLAACFSRELADYTIQVIDVAGGDKIPRKGGPGLTQSDLLVINKTDLAAAVGADLEVMRRDAVRMRGEGPFVFAQVKHGPGVDEIVGHILHAWRHALSIPHEHTCAGDGIPHGAALV